MSASNSLQTMLTFRAGSTSSPPPPSHFPRTPKPTAKSPNLFAPPSSVHPAMHPPSPSVAVLVLSCSASSLPLFSSSPCCAAVQRAPLSPPHSDAAISLSGKCRRNGGERACGPSSIPLRRPMRFNGLPLQRGADADAGCCAQAAAGAVPVRARGHPLLDLKASQVTVAASR